MSNKTASLRRFWVSWWMTEANGAFELHSPWWVSGERMDGAQSVCAAIMARDEIHVMRIIYNSHDRTVDELEWRFIEERPADWSPFSDRFRRADWMKWESSSEK